MRVYWPSDDDWYSGMVVMQETTPEGIVYSKIDYDDGDEEVLNLANEICECLDADEDGLVYRPRPSSRRAASAVPGALALEYQGGHENESVRQPISMEEVLEAMNRREAARGLYELSGEPHEAKETYRLGYMMGVRRASQKAADVIQTVLARVFPEGDPMRSIFTREDLLKAIVDGTYEADPESDVEDEPAEEEANDPEELKEYDAPWPVDANIPTEQDVLDELEAMRAKAKAEREASTQSLEELGEGPKLVLKMKKRMRDAMETGGEEDALTNTVKVETALEVEDAPEDAPPEDATASATPLADQRRVALNKVVNVEYAGDKSVLRWLDTHGWGHFAGAFAWYGVTRRVLNHLTMTDFENMRVDAEFRSKMMQALDRRRKRNEKYRLNGT